MATTTREQTVNQQIAINGVLRLIEAARVSTMAILREANMEARRQDSLLKDHETENEFGERENRIAAIIEAAGGALSDQGGGEIDVFFGELSKRIQDWAPDHA